MSFAVALVPRWPRPRRESNTCRWRVAGTYGRGLVIVSQYRAISVPGTWIFSKRRAVAPCKRVVSSASVSCASTKASGKTDVLTAYTRDSVGDHVVLPGDMTDICRELGYKIEIVKLPWAALVASLAEGVGQRLVVGEGQEVPCFKHMTEMLDSLVDSQQLSVVGAIFLLRCTHFLGEEC